MPRTILAAAIFAGLACGGSGCCGHAPQDETLTARYADTGFGDALKALQRDGWSVVENTSGSGAAFASKDDDTDDVFSKDRVMLTLSPDAKTGRVASVAVEHLNLSL